MIYVDYVIVTWQAWLRVLEIETERTPKQNDATLLFLCKIFVLTSEE